MAIVIPTLNINQPIITQSSDQMAYLLKFMFWNPGWTSSIVESTLLSLRKLRAKYTEDISTYPQAIEALLKMAVYNYNTQWTASVRTDRIEDRTYALVISIVGNDGVPIINNDSIVIRDGQVMLRTDLEIDKE